MYLFCKVKYFLLSPTLFRMGLKTGIVQESCLNIDSILTVLLTLMKQKFWLKKTQFHKKQAEVKILSSIISAKEI